MGIKWLICKTKCRLRHLDFVLVEHWHHMPPLHNHFCALSLSVIAYGLKRVSTTTKPFFQVHATTGFAPQVALLI